MTPRESAQKEAERLRQELAALKTQQALQQSISNSPTSAELTAAQKEAERIKFSVLFNLDSFSNIDPESVRAALEHPLPDDISMAYSNWLAEFVKEVGRNPTTDECRHIQTCLCSEYKS